MLIETKGIKPGAVVLGYNPSTQEVGVEGQESRVKVTQFL